MDPIRSWLLGVVLCALAAAIAERFAPDGAMRGAVRVTAGLTVLLALLAPLREVRLEPGSLPDYRDALARTETELRSAQETAMAEGIAQKLEAYIEDRTPAHVRVAVSYEDGAPRIDSVTIEGERDGETAALLSQLGIPEGRQIWTGNG